MDNVQIDPKIMLQSGIMYYFSLWEGGNALRHIIFFNEIKSFIFYTMYRNVCFKNSIALSVVQMIYRDSYFSSVIIMIRQY